MSHGFEDVEGLGGEIVVDKEQSSVIDKINASLEQADPNVSHGLCMGYSSMWIVKSAKGDDFWEYVDSTDARADLLVMARREGNIGTMMQAGMFDKMSEDDKKKVLGQQGKWAQDLILRSQTVAKSGDRYERKGFDGDAIYDLCEHLTKGDGYKLLCMQGMTKGSHAVAVSVSEGKVTYMDPNAGEVKFETADEFNIWFSMSHLPSYKFAKFTGFYIDSYSAPVNVAQAAQQYSPWKTYELPTGTRRPFATTERKQPAPKWAAAKPSAKAATGSPGS